VSDASPATTVPLTAEQQAWLRTNTILPVMMLVLMLLVLAALGICVVGPLLGHPLVRIFAIVAALLALAVVVAVALHIRSHRADLRMGAAQVRVARLAQKRDSGHSPRTFYAGFEQIGSVIVQYEVYQTLNVGSLYRVVYSPHTRRGWVVDEPRLTRRQSFPSEFSGADRFGGAAAACQPHPSKPPIGRPHSTSAATWRRTTPSGQWRWSTARSSRSSASAAGPMRARARPLRAWNASI
jgi:hypothetical protein